MYVIAVIGDLASLVPFLNIVSGVITAIALGIAGAETGVSIYSSKRIGGTLAALVAEEIPMVSTLPLWTIRVYFAKQDAKLRSDEQ